MSTFCQWGFVSTQLCKVAEKPNVKQVIAMTFPKQNKIEFLYKKFLQKHDIEAITIQSFAVNLIK